MSTINTIQSTDAISASRSTINTNFSNLNTDKLESSNIKTVNGNSLIGSGDVTISASANIPVKDEGTTITSAVSSFNFVGTGVTATNVGNDVTVTISSGGGSGDMILASAQTNSGLKTFLDGTFGLRNVANTFTGLFTNAITTARTWTFPDKNGTVAMTSDITGTNSGTNTGDETTARINALYGATNAITVGSVEVGHASDTTISRVSAGRIAVEGVNVPTISSTDTLTNKRITKRVTSATPVASPYQIDVSTTDTQEITGLSIALQFQNPAGSPTNGQLMLIRVKDNGTARALTYDTQFASGAATLPTTTTISKWTWILCEYVTADTKWYCIASGTQP